MFFLEILISACASSSLKFHMIYPAYKLDVQGNNIQTWHTPFLIWNQSVIPCLFLTVTSWPAYRYLRRQEWWSCIPISLRIFQFAVICTVIGFDIINKAEVNIFLELSCFFYDLSWVGTKLKKDLHGKDLLAWVTYLLWDLASLSQRIFSESWLWNSNQSNSPRKTVVNIIWDKSSTVPGILL